MSNKFLIFNQHYSMPHRHIKVLLVTLFQSGYFTAPPVKVEKLQPYKINVGRAYVCCVPNSVLKHSKLRCAIFLPKSAKKGATQFFSESAKNFGQKRPKFEFFLAGIILKIPYLTIFIAFLYDNILTKRNSWFFFKKSFKIGHF